MNSFNFSRKRQSRLPDATKGNPNNVIGSVYTTKLRVFSRLQDDILCRNNPQRLEAKNSPILRASVTPALLPLRTTEAFQKSETRRTSFRCQRIVIRILYILQKILYILNFETAVVLSIIRLLSQFIIRAFTIQNAFDLVFDRSNSLAWMVQINLALLLLLCWNELNFDIFLSSIKD